MSFPSPHEIHSQVIPETEGWEQMYPYHFQLATEDSELLNYENQAFWFYDSLHFPETLYPFDSIWLDAIHLGLSQYNHRIFRFPSVRGIDCRIINGYVYLSPVPVTDPDEIEQRIPDFIQRAGFYYERWSELENRWKIKMESMIGELRSLAIPSLPDIEPLHVVTDATGKSSGFNLLQAFDRLIELGIQCWQYHFEFLNLGYAAYVTFSDFVLSLFPSLPIQELTCMISGIDVIMYQPDFELKLLAHKAIELGVDTLICSGLCWNELEPRLATDPQGQEWLKALDSARDPWFYVSTGTGFYHHHRCWNDAMDFPLSAIKTYIEKILEGIDIERSVEHVRAERDRITNELRTLITKEQDRHQFDQLLHCARTVFPYVENHLFYVEHCFHSHFWNKVREVAVILKEQGILNEVEEIWYLRHSEIKEALWDVTTAWATGSPVRGKIKWAREISWRSKALESFRQWQPPPVLGKAPESIKDPFMIMLWGVTSESITAWTRSQSRESADSSVLTYVEGIPASLGSVSGKVRICVTVEDLAHLRENEILVAPTTSPSWSPAFARARACITDVGGVMSHAAILCREYRIPAIVGTGQATRILKTGMYVHIEVSSSKGMINIDHTIKTDT
jgi:pyruvate, water dikinase